MKEFMRYQLLLEKFKEKFNQFKEIHTIYIEREKTGLTDSILDTILDNLSTDMAELCCDRYNDIEKEGFTNILYDFINGDNEVYCYNNKSNKKVSYILNDVEDLFDFCYAYYLKSNLINSSKEYAFFCSETRDAYLLLCYDNDYIDDLYTEEQLIAIADEITDYYISHLDLYGTWYCWYDGDSFSFQDHRYISIEEYKQLQNQINNSSYI